MTSTKRNASRNTTATRSPVRLSNRGCGAVALAVAVLVAVAGTGHTGSAAVGAGALYLLVSGRVAAVVPSAKQVLRGVAWVVAAVALLAASRGTTAAGGPLLGAALAAALMTYLKLSASRRNSRRR